MAERTQLDRIEAMLGELLRRQTPPEALERLWRAFPWLLPPLPPLPPTEPNALAAWLNATAPRPEANEAARAAAEKETR